MSRTPEPRPALQKAPDGAVHPATAPRTSPPKHLHAAPQAPTVVSAASTYKPGDLRARKAKSKTPSEPLVDLKVEVPKSVRKTARKKAERRGEDLNMVVTTLLRAWVDG